jgi:hypothetical protein
MKLACLMCLSLSCAAPGICVRKEFDRLEPVRCGTRLAGKCHHSAVAVEKCIAYAPETSSTLYPATTIEVEHD